jgi:hypothetical protein
MATLKGLWYMSKKVLVSMASFVAILAVVLVQGVEDGREIEPFIGVTSFTQPGAGWRGIKRKMHRRVEEGDQGCGGGDDSRS